MEYNSQLELYRSLSTVFLVKKRLLSITKYQNISSEDIWKYLSINKWRYSHNLTISDIINDIITVDAKDINDFLGGK